MEDIDSYQGSGDWDTGGKKGREQPKNMYERPMDMDNGVGMDCGRGGVDWVEEG